MLGLLFSKYHGAGNDFIVIDNTWGQYSHLFPSPPRRVSSEDTTTAPGGRCPVSPGSRSCLPALIRRACDRHLGVGGDGLIVLTRNSPVEQDFEMTYYNSDGSTGMLCGNGTRCAVAFAQHLGLVKTRNDGVYTFLPICRDGNQKLEGCVIGATNSRAAAESAHSCPHLAKDLKNALDTDHSFECNVRISMPAVENEVVRVDKTNFYIFCGSPHHVRTVGSAAELHSIDVLTEGARVRYDLEQYGAIGGTNVNFIFVEPTTGVIAIRTYERGVETETLACGTGALAASLVANYIEHAGIIGSEGVICQDDVMDAGCNNSNPRVRVVNARGGQLTVTVRRWNQRANGGGIVGVIYDQIMLEGPTARVFDGSLLLKESDTQY